MRIPADTCAYKVTKIQYLNIPIEYNMGRGAALWEKEPVSTRKLIFLVSLHVYAKEKADHGRSESCGGWSAALQHTALQKADRNISQLFWKLWSRRLAGDAFDFHKRQRSLINVAENLLFLHYKRPLINNMSLEASAITTSGAFERLQTFGKSHHHEIKKQLYVFVRSISCWINVREVTRPVKNAERRDAIEFLEW